MSWQESIIGASDSLRVAASVMNSASHKLILVTSQKGILLGTVSDGDLRRAMLRGLGLDKPVTEIMNSTFIAGRADMSLTEQRALMKLHEIDELPIIDGEGNIVNLVSIRQEEPKFKGTFVIMAGGRGVRMMPLTEATPKPMLLVGSKPILEHILISAISQGFSDFVISVNYLSEVIEAHFGDGSKWGVAIRYLREEKPLGTAGALSLLPEDTPGPILVANGDLITNLDFRSMLQNHTDTKSGISIAVRRFELRNPYGVIATNGNYVSSIEEKPTYVSQVNTGIYVLDSEAVRTLRPNEFCNMTDLVQTFLDTGRRVAAFPVHESWRDIGTPGDYLSANEL
jgi:dTDP-glucose pyrophosphorylase